MKALAALIAVGLVVGGLVLAKPWGSSSNGDRTGHGEAAAPVSKQPPSHDAVEGDNKGEHRDDKPESRSRRTSSKRAALRKGAEQIPPEQRQQFSHTAALGTLQGFGIPDAEISVSDDGYSVIIAISPSHACVARPADVPEILKQLRRVIMYSRSIDLNVAFHGPLARYVRKDCGRQELPEVDGQVVYSKAGSGYESSPMLRIQSRKWTVAVENSGGVLEVFVLRAGSGELVKPAIKTSGRGVGKRSYRGPGNFHIIVKSANRWRIRAYDGS